MFVFKGPNGEEIKDNQVIVVNDRVKECYRFIDSAGRAYLLDPVLYPGVKTCDIITVDKASLTSYRGERNVE
jgi:hypothetical protein